jgi:hypothetical protein
MVCAPSHDISFAMMSKPAYSKELNVAIILRGLRAGVFALAVTTAAGVLLGILITMLGNARLANLGEYQPWMPIICGEYGFLAGIVIGIFVGWITCWECLRPPD